MKVDLHEQNLKDFRENIYRFILSSTFFMHRQSNKKKKNKQKRTRIAIEWKH